MRLAASNDRRETISPIMAVASEAADPLAIPAHHQPIAVMLDSWTHSGPDGGRATLDGRHGSTNPGDVFLRDRRKHVARPHHRRIPPPACCR
jgi:hypothetical protein